MKLKTALFLVMNGFASLTSSMAQSNIIQISNQQKKVAITYASAESKLAAEILYSYLEKSLPNTFEIQKNNKELKDQEFILKSNSQDISLLATNLKSLKYAVYTLLEKWEFRKFTATVSYIPKPDAFIFPKNFYQKYQPTFAYRTL